MGDQDQPDPQFDAMTARLLQREALRRAAEELNTTSGPGLEGVLARISAEVTAQAASRTSGTEGVDTSISATHSPAGTAASDTTTTKVPKLLGLSGTG